jgi:putative DNA primase/helicase
MKIDTAVAIEFLNCIREGPGYLGFKAIDGKFKQVWFETNAQALELAEPLASSCDVWVSIASFPEKSGTRHARQAENLCCFFLDVDAHGSSRYSTVDEIERALEAFLADTGLPSPSLIHRTGYGLHVFWVLKQKLSSDVWVEQAAMLQGLAETLNLGADPITADAARILRLAGTYNFRNPPTPKATEVVHLDKKWIESEVFEAALVRASAKYPRTTKATPQIVIASEVPSTTENIGAVRQMLACLDPDPEAEGGGNRATWRQVVWGVAALGWGEVGYQLVNDWSAGGDLYDERDLLGIWQSYDPNWRGAGGNRATGVGTLVLLAREAGYAGSNLVSSNGRNFTDFESVPLTAQTFRQEHVGLLVTRLASEIEPEVVEWLVPDSIPLGCIVVIAGQPGLGKSQIAINLASGVTTGKGLPKEAVFCNLGSVIILANEDDAARTIRPRLDAAGADVTKVHIVEGVAREAAGVDFFQLDTDVDTLRAKAKQLGDVRLIVIDPPTAYLGPKSDSYKDADVRRVLAPLSQLAQETGALVLLVVHLNKRTDGGPQQRIGGSVAWTAAPRAAFMAIMDETSAQRHLVPVKNNLGDDKTGFPYRIEETILDYSNQKIKSSRIVWMGTSQVSASELLNPSKARASPTKDAAKAFLEDELSTGPMKVTDLKDAAKGAGIAWSAIQRAKDELLVTSKKQSNGWIWELVKRRSYAQQ